MKSQGTKVLRDVNNNLIKDKCMRPQDCNMNRGDNDPNNPLHNKQAEKNLRLSIYDLIVTYANNDISVREYEEIAQEIFNKITKTW